MDPSRWTEDLSVGDARIDAQHRSIFEHVALLEADLAAGRGVDAQREVAFLRRYAMQHFAAEEALLERWAWPEGARHQRLHQDLAAAVLEAEARIQEGGEAAAAAAAGVVTGILDHIRMEDARFGAFFREHTRRTGEGHPLGRSLRAVEADHHLLFQHLHDLTAGIREGDGEAVLESLLPRLRAFCRDHFRREEMMMDLTGYAGAESHRAEHRDLRAGLEALGRLQAEGEPAAAQGLALLDRWTLAHLTGEDFRLAAFLWSNPGPAPAAGA